MLDWDLKAGRPPPPPGFGSVVYRMLEVDVRYMRGNGEAHIVWKSSLGL